jgi:uncharacterized membrane protein
MISTMQDYIDRRVWKFLTCLVLLSFALFPGMPELSALIRSTLADAYIQVSSFVCVTLIIFYGLERHFRVDTAKLMKRHEKWQVPIAALIGALPGCGGAIIVITQYVLGRIGFGSMVAVLTATMGDAAFLLLAQSPKTALAVMAISIVMGTISGLIVERIHGPDFMRKKITKWQDFRHKCGRIVQYGRAIQLSWYGLMIPGFALGLGNAFQVDTDLWFGALSTLSPTSWIGFTGAMYCLMLWAILPDKGLSMVNLAAHPACRTHVKNRNRIIFETAFVTTWVVAAFLLFELTIHFTQFDLHNLFQTTAPLVPLIAVLVGFIPGCGPQIIVTTLYLSGVLPFSAQIGNAISNDGDALFPAISLAPKTAILATLYTAVPALFVAYGYYFLFEI